MAETITAKIQVRRGDLNDLPVLEEGEFGYALDYHRLFIGNSPIEFMADGNTTTFPISERALIPGQMSVIVNGTPLRYPSDYYVYDTDVIFTTAPQAGSIVVISHNTELSVVNQRVSREVIELSPNVTDLRMPINWNLSNYNTASIDYSMKSSNGNMAVGTLKIITDGSVVSIVDVGGTLGETGIILSGEVDQVNNRVHLTYTNSTNSTANFFYSIQLWNTI